MKEQEVRTLLEDLADTPAPPSRVDVPSAVTMARRQARVRAWTSVAAASVLVVALAVGVTYVVAGGSQAPPDSTTSVASAPERFDPLVEYASFGWVPERSRMNSSRTTVSGVRYMTSVSQHVPDPSQPMAALPAANVTACFYAAGFNPKTEQRLDVRGPSDSTESVAPVTEAPAVNGAPAYWFTVPSDPEMIILKWRYAPNAWAEVYVSRLDGDLRQIAHRVASEMLVGGTERLRFPFHLTGVPDGLRPVATTIAEGGLDAPWDIELNLSTSPENVERGLRVEVSVEPITESEKRDPNTTVDGHPATRHTSVGDNAGGAQVSDTLLVHDDPVGLNTFILVDAKTTADAAPLGPDGALGLYHALTLHPNTADWTGDPLR
jgi:hypothetical protein